MAGGRGTAVTIRTTGASRFAVAALVLGVVTLALAIWFATGLGGDLVVRNASNAALSIAPLVAAVGCFLRSRRASGRVRWSWTLIGMAVLSWGAGEVVWTVYETFLNREVPFPSPADIGYLGMPVFTAVALLMLPVRAQSAAQLVRAVLDGLIIAGSLLLVSWLVVLGPLIDAGADSNLSLVISLAYPASDVVTVTMVLFMLALGRRSNALSMPLVLVGAGLVTFAIADSGFAYLTLIGAYQSGSVNDVGWFAGFLLVFLASLKPESTRSEAAVEASRSQSFAILLPYVAVLGAVVTSMVTYALHGHSDHFTAWSRSGLILLLVGRQVLTMLENRSLTRGLEARVLERTVQLQSNERRFEALVQHSAEVVAVVDKDSTVRYLSAPVDPVLGIDSHQLIGRNLVAELDTRAGRTLTDALSRSAEKPYAVLTVELQLEVTGSTPRSAEVTITNLLADEHVAGLVLNIRDVTQRRKLENQLVHEAFHDSLTGLANRALFADRLTQAFRRRDDGSGIAVLFIDLDGFKEVNDSQGHAAGDELLVTVARRLEQSVRPQDTVARFGGDEFAVLIDAAWLDDELSPPAVAGRILERLGEPIRIEDRELTVHASIGIASADVDAEDADQLMRNADLAMYRAKAEGTGGFTSYHAGMHTDLVDRLQLEADMRTGLEQGQFELFYQPTITLETGVITGFEALIRWHHPEQGLVAPLKFIPLAESTGFIRQLGGWVLQQACRQAVEWTTAEGRPISMNVNVSTRQVDQHDFVDFVAETLAVTGLAPEQLCLEMTESILLSDSDDVLDTLNALKGLGLRLAIDDFGTGYSSLSYLHRFPFDTLKIDKSFVDRLTSASGESTLAKTIVQLGQGLGVTTVAEGLEHFEQFMMLRRMGCQVGQGYYFSRPVPAGDATRLLSDPGVGEAMAPASEPIGA